MLRAVLKTLGTLAVLLTLLSTAVLAGCGSSGDSNPPPPTTDVTVTLTQAQDVQSVTVLQADGSQWDSIYTATYSTPQSTIVLHLSLDTGQTYKVQARMIDGSEVEQEFVAGTGPSGSQTFPESRSMTGARQQQVTISVPQMHRIAALQ